jgi:hypothetical protein
MDRLRAEAGSEWLSLGDWVFVVAATLLLMFGLYRQVRAEEMVEGAPKLFADPALECPSDVCNPACRERICHVLDPIGLDPCWSGRAEALLLWRDAPQSVPLYDYADGSGVALDANGFESAMAAGPRFTIFRHTGDQGAIEFNYFRVQFFESAQSLPTTSGGYLDPQPRGIYCCPVVIPPRDSVGGSMSSGFQSFELNRRFPTDGRWQWLAGFRWVQWQDAMALRSTSDYEGIFVANDYNTTTFNDLYGMQIGADSFLIDRGGPWRVEGIGKAGVYYNQAVQSSSYSAAYSNGFSFAPLSVSTAIGQAAFVGELGLTGVYDLNDTWSLRAGYAIFWLGGLALAPNQIDGQKLCPDNPVSGSTDTGGSVVAQGITLGFEGRY